MADGPSTPPHIVLVGLPGSGKTTVGRALADRLGRPFLDFDDEIERREGRPIADIFASRGEAYFREVERALTEEMRAVGGGMVLAPGGGWVTIPAVVRLLRPPASVIYLMARPAAVVERMGSSHRRRPLLAVAEPVRAVERLLADREPLYRAAADLAIDTEVVDVEGVVNAIVRAPSVWGGTAGSGGGLKDEG